jgi:hypothetical protein
LIDRRTLLEALVGIALVPAALARAQTPPARSALDPTLARALASSPYVYVSPLLRDGAESSCHAEVWFGWIDGAVVVISAATTWKARSLARGLTRARLWVGDYGRWKQMIGRNEAFRAGPSCVARASPVRSDGVLDELLASYEKKYPSEIGAWRDKMRAGVRDGSRVLIRYAPEAPPAGATGAART